MFLALAAILLLGVVAVQNYLYPPLREETISDGLFGPYHWFLDGAYVVLGTALVHAFHGMGLASFLADVIALCLGVTAVSNTFSGIVDKLTHGMHSKIHTWFTMVMFLTMLGLEYTQMGWKMVVANVAIPALVGGFFTVFKKWKIVPGPAAEKAAVAVMCAFMVAWSILR
jgi:hypothetical protein